MTTIGIDPHKATHTAVAVDDNEHVVDEFQLRASSRQAERLRAWADGFAEREWAVESANGLGYLVAQQLVAAGEVVFDVPPVLASRVRVLGSGHSQKNDPNDARSVAIAAMRSDRLARVRPDDHGRVLEAAVALDVVDGAVSAATVDVAAEGLSTVVVVVELISWSVDPLAATLLSAPHAPSEYPRAAATAPVATTLAANASARAPRAGC